MTIRRTTTALFVPAALAAFACSSAATAQATFEFTDSGQTLGNSNSNSVALGDLDGDGDLDAWVANFSNQANTVFTNDGSGTFTDSGQTLGNSYSASVALGDLDGDGDLDAWVANFSDQANTVFINDGSGTFTDSGQTLGNSDSALVALGDLDGDGDLDAMVANYNGQANTVFTNDGSGTFTDSGQTAGNGYSLSVALGDLDGDGDLDAFVANNNGQANTVFTNDGSGTFADSGQTLGNSWSQSVALGDLDGDGDLDAMVANYNGQANTVFTNDGSGTFTDSGQTLGNGYSLSVALGDLDGDGDLDAWVTNANNQANTVFTNDGSGTFTDSGQTLGNSYSVLVALGDLDGDGDLDAWVANTSNQPNTVWINDPSGISAVCNLNTGVWHDSAREAIDAAAPDDDLLVAGSSFDIPGVIDSRELPLTFLARCPVAFGEDLLFLASDGSSFLNFDEAAGGYTIWGAFIAPEAGTLLFSSLDIGTGGELAQNDAQLFVQTTMTNTAGAAFLRGEIYAFDGGTSTETSGVNRVARDTDVYGDYTNAGTTIIQRGILYIFGDLVNTGTLTGEYNNGFNGGGEPEPGDGFNVGGSYTIGQAATLSMPDPVWWLRVGGDLDVAINDPANFVMSEATIELNGLAPGKLQTLEALSADLGAVEAGFDPSNFPIGTLRITSDSTTQLVNNHVNSVEAACEVLYVNELFVAAGGSLLTGGCTIYVRSAQIDGTVDDPESIVIVEGTPPCPADLTGDGEVSGADLGLMIAFWGTPGGDLTGDGTTTGADLGLLIASWGACPR